MILDCDLSGLEWRVAAFLSQDKIMMQEIIDGCDAHSDNAEQILKDRSRRQDAKVVSFRSIYGGSPYAFFMDPNMPNFSLDEWTEIMGRFWEKYKGLHSQHRTWIRTVYAQGYIKNPTGRILTFHKVRKSDGSIGYSNTQAVNYPVQSLATADIVPLAIVVANKRLRKAGIPFDFINAVHDSLVYDCPTEKSTEDTAKVVLGVFRDLPKLIKAYFGFDFNVPLDGEAKAGDTWGTMSRLDL